MNHKEKDRPFGGGKRMVANQYVYIGFVGIKSCGKPVVMDGGPHES